MDEIGDDAVFGQASEELARLQASALLYYEQTRAQASRIQTMEDALARLEKGRHQSASCGELNQELAQIRQVLAEREKLVSNLKSALVVKEQMRFDLELKLRSVLDRGEVAIQVRSGIQSAHPDTVAADAAAVAEPAARYSNDAADVRGDLRRVRLLNYRSLLSQFMVSGGRTAAPYPALAAPSKGFLFLITYPRSGDLVLQKLLNEIPGYCIRGELGGALQPVARAWAETVSEGQRSDRDDFEVASLDFGWAISNDFVADVLTPPEDVRVTGFRSNTVHSDIDEFWRGTAFLYSNFPNARILFNMRNNEKVSRSGPWANQPQEEVLRKLGAMDGFFTEFAQAHPERSLCIRYEDYTSSRHGLGKLYDFLGEEAVSQPE